MRPVEKGASPYMSVSHYSHALPHLEKRIGCFCSYCEMNINHAPEIEHVFAKSIGGSETEWDNLLLACKYCNTRKGTVIGDEEKGVWLWPDTDNTFLAFEYEDGLVKLKEGYLKSIAPSTFEKAKRMFEDLKLDNIPISPREKDRRWFSRNNTYDQAKVSLQSWLKAKGTSLKDEMKGRIISLAVSSGFFSVWMAVFQDEPEIRNSLINGFVGTSKECFDTVGDPIPRIGGEI